MEYTMDRRVKLEISREIINAIKELHSERIEIVHGDIKTNNNICTLKEGKVIIKLIDFGA